MRQEPAIVMNGQGARVRRWLAWGICTRSGEMAELTMDPDKARVWRDGGHKVVGFIYDEPTDDAQGQLL